MDPAQEKAEAEAFLKSLVNRTLRIHTTDSRMFVGTFKCTDPKLAEAAAADPNSETVTADMTSRYLGLVVIPGEHIVKMEVEEFVSQLKSRSFFGRREVHFG
ncbi:putative lsm domain-containing protein [Eutypa lata UCREL1]|uniref:Putative lsm domain-containing protein n=1 Tax=Eutypa lata (strain UCR-EL1) TaxID=1287681 RepID=M7SZP2_EUTLA|nr:putative lsm domain-containing protein [Eutypa lata UCREL1]